MSDWVMSDHCLSDWSCQTTTSQMEDRLQWLGRTQVQYDTNAGDNASGQLATRQETKWILDLGICIFVYLYLLHTVLWLLLILLGMDWVVVRCTI